MRLITLGYLWLLVPIMVSFLPLNSIANDQDSHLKPDHVNFNKAAVFTLKGQRDSVHHLLDEISSDFKKERQPYVDAMTRVAEQEHSYADLVKVWNLSGGVIEHEMESVDNFEQLSAGLSPSNTVLNEHYIDYLWFLTTVRRNLNQLPQADSLNQVLINYLDQFPGEERAKTKGKVYTQIHGNMMYMIQRDLEQGIPNSQKTLELAWSTNDTNLIIAASFYLAEFYVLSRNLPAFLKLVEENYELDRSRNRKSGFYNSTIFQWLDALIYSGQDFDRVEQLIAEVEKDEKTLARSLEYRLTFLAVLPPNSEWLERQLQKFGCNSLPELSMVLDSTASAELNPNNYTNFLRSAAKMLFKHKYYAEAMRFMQRAMNNTQKFYSAQLSKDLAEVKANQVKREKDLEIAAEQEKSRLYVTIAIISAVLLILGITVIVLLFRQSQRMRAKNLKIESQKNELEKANDEKALLLKEIHHRVKNNFQIVSSLLELQTKGIEDDKARELAEEGKNRVKSMALIHQRLYQNDDMLISFDDYITALVDEISDMYKPEENVQVSIDAKGMNFDIDTAIPLGLIINELVTNSFKYGLDAKDAALDIKVEKDEQEYRLTVKDNGIGLPKNLDLTKAKSLGLRLVKRLSQQLKGRATTIESEGAAIAVYFKDTAARSLLS